MLVKLSVRSTDVTKLVVVHSSRSVNQEAETSASCFDSKHKRPGGRDAPGFLFVGYYRDVANRQQPSPWATPSRAGIRPLPVTGRWEGDRPRSPKQRASPMSFAKRNAAVRLAPRSFSEGGNDRPPKSSVAREGGRAFLRAASLHTPQVFRTRSIRVVALHERNRPTPAPSSRTQAPVSLPSPVWLAPQRRRACLLPQGWLRGRGERSTQRVCPE